MRMVLSPYLEKRTLIDGLKCVIKAWVIQDADAGGQEFNDDTDVVVKETILSECGLKNNDSGKLLKILP